MLSVQLSGTGAAFNQIGKDRGSNTAAQNWLGDIAEVIVFDGDITDGERIIIHNYLSQKWGLTDTVDSDGDGVVDASDFAPTDDSVQEASNVIVDTDGDGVSDELDAYPTDSGLVMADYAPAKDVYGSVAYEDLWPQKGDYDFNDVVIDYQYKYAKDADNKVRKIELSMKVSSYATYTNGIGIMFEGIGEKISSVSGVGNVSGISVASTGVETGHGSDGVIILSTNQHSETATMNVTIEFSEGIEKSVLGDAPHNLFIYSQETRGQEIHLPGHKHSNKMDTDMFKTGDDNTTAETAHSRYKTEDDLPWALHVAEKFDHPQEGRSIHQAYTKFSEWVQSGGSQGQDWYSNHAHRNAAKIKVRKK